jgi:hypothetical protein
MAIRLGNGPLAVPGPGGTAAVGACPPAGQVRGSCDGIRGSADGGPLVGTLVKLVFGLLDGGLPVKKLFGIGFSFRFRRR